MGDDFVQQKFNKLDEEAIRSMKFDNKTPNLVCRKLGALLESAKKEHQKKDYEKTYILLWRWKYVANWLKENSKDLDPSLKQKFIGSEVSEFNKFYNEIKDKLKERYELDRKISEPGNTRNRKVPINIEEIDKFLPNTPDDEPQEKTIFDISCRELFDFVEGQKFSVLVIDIRTKEDFEKSTISLKNLNIINIPPHLIALRKVSLNNIKELCSQHTKLTSVGDRWYIDKIVLFDGDSRFDGLKKNSLLKILEKLLTEWRNQFALYAVHVLMGGWKEWNMVFPDKITKKITNNDVQSLNIKKLNLENADKTNNVITDNFHMDFSSIENGINDSNDHFNLSFNNPSTLLSTDNARKRIFSQTESIDQKLTGEPKVVLNKVINTIPTVDRSKKPKEKSNGVILNNNFKSNTLKPVSNFNISTDADWEKEHLDASKKTNLYPTLDSLGSTFQSSKTKKHDKENNKPEPPQDPYIIRNTNSVDMEVDETESNSIIQEQSKSTNQLKRSISSPNLAQIDKNIPKPEYDRNTKPSTRKTPDRISNINREQRLEGVYVSDGKENPGITGLKNLGNSCYMNSIIQCLSNTSHLAKYFLENALEINSSNGNRKQYIAEEVGHVIKALWRGKYKSISPRDLKEVVGQYKASFYNNDQQDSHEFLTFLLDWLHNDLRKDNSLKDKFRDELSEAELQWEKSMDKKSSIISQLFSGQQRSTIQCNTCGTKSITYETSNCLTLTLPQSARCNLTECITRYTSSQTITEWKCTSCKVPREAKKKFDFVKLAPIVVMHLNRFGDSSGWLEKKNTAVDFPLRNLDLQPYLDKSDINNSQSYKYNLYAMSNHYGTMEAGHYTAYCKTNNQNRWYKFDDQMVSEVPESTVKSQSSNAYLLFYSSIPSSNLNCYN